MRRAPALALALVLAGCVEPRPYPWPDAGALDAASADAGPDCARDGCADPERPECDPGTGRCVACLDDAGCGALAPRCEAGVCVSCLAPDAPARCDESARLAELFARVCEANGALEGDGALADDLLALVCSGHAADGPEAAFLEDGAARGLLRIDASALAACAAEGSPRALDLADCPGLVVGRVAEGVTCGTDAVCASGRCARGVGCLGACAVRAGSGAACERDVDCALGLACVRGSCASPPAAGMPCSATCAAGLVCATGVCAPPGGPGAACRDYVEGDCAEGLVCAVDRCVEAPAAGAPCVSSSLGERCAAGLRCMSGRCASPAAEGEACAETAACARGLRCVSGRCASRVAPGARCTAGTACPLGMGCLAGRCRALPDVGGACDDAVGCYRGACSAGTCEALADGVSCARVATLFDARDPCGDRSSCLDLGAGPVCVAEGDEGAVCGDRMPCRRPDLVCDGGRCAAACAP